MALNGLFALACLYTLAFTRPVLFPVVVAVLLYFLVRPVVRGLERLRVPRMAGSGLVVIALLAAVVLAVWGLARPASDWVSRAPQSLRRIEAKAHSLIERVEKVNRTAEQVERIATPGGDRTPEVQVKEPGLGALVFGGVQAAIWTLVAITALLFLLLASGEGLMREAIRWIAGVRREDAAELALAIEKQLSSYLLVLTVIYAVYGALVGLALGLLGMPNPALWGVLAFLLNYVPYVGPLTCGAFLGLAAMLTFSGAAQPLIVMAVYFTMHALETNVVTPMILGRRLTLSPPLLFVALLFWLWVWGVPGALLAVPLLAAIKIVCEHVERLRPVAELLGEGGGPERA